MADVEARGAARVGFGHLDQRHQLKPTSAFGLLEQLLPEIWTELAGMSRDAYFAAHPARLVFSHLRIQRLPCPLRLDEQVRLEFDGLVGRYPGRDGQPRFGLQDRFSVLSSDSVPALRWTAEVFWVGVDGERAAGYLRQEAPALRHEQSRELDPPPPRPDVAGEPAGAFRWTPRETDFNRHVYFQSYLERAENALCDAGLDPAAATSWDLWFSRPAFEGEHMALTLGQAADGSRVIGFQKADGTACATVLAAWEEGR